jgi:hypothetical protein
LNPKISTCNGVIYNGIDAVGKDSTREIPGSM